MRAVVPSAHCTAQCSAAAGVRVGTPTVGSITSACWAGTSRSRSARPCTMFVRMTQAYIGVLRKVGYHAPQPKSPISIRSGISDYIGPSSTPENFSSTGLLCSSLAIPNMYGLCPFLVYFYFFCSSCSSAQVGPLDRFSPFMGQKMRFGVRKCLLGVRIVKKYFYPKFLGKNMKIRVKSLFLPL